MNLKILQTSDFEFWTDLKTRWSDMDSLNHINHASYLSYMETARVQLYIDLGFGGISTKMDQSTILASMDVHYLVQAKHPTNMRIGHRISRVGNKSFDLMTGVFNKKNDILLCSALFKMVAFNYRTERTIPVPKKIREYCHPTP